MTLICYREQNFKGETRKLIDHAVGILEEYQAQGFVMTLRQLYYQFVSRDIIPNTLQSYKRLGDVLNNARMAGELSWDMLEDRTRNVHEWQHETGPKEALERIRAGYFIDRWDNQPRRVMVLVEKDALAGVIERPCAQWDLPFLSCRGYLSQSEAWRLGRQCLEWRERGQEPFLLDLRDHDPSGVDMTRDLRDRLEIFSNPDPENGWNVAHDLHEPIEVVRLALNMDQVRHYRPPPNPAKMTDARAEDYVSKFGRQSWELDALSPTVIADLITDAVQAVLDPDAWEESDKRLKAERAKLDAFIATLEADPEP